MMTPIPNHKKLIVFDGVCNLCNGAVNYVIKHDKKNKFMFTALQSNAGQQLVNDFNINTSKIDSILLYTPQKSITYKSTAVLKIAYQLGFPHNMMGVFFIIPPFIRNRIYDGIAKNRYRWFGKKETCMIPTPELKKKFLE
ncbi:thiol-disulfide oxidoreductase DCC family protein [Aestuariivivens insulae]|uniref:thiol-disulfide oxidoreductase DCC family protein n=1 Tax=Aestuariivivens insulae TaxID=1621988 RepID=UPI001F585B1A|nr:thiol-disulfide oxidoreductase DCC family protein [Aestuariivivens insulae]